MSKIKLVFRGVNGRNRFRKLNSEGELLDKTVQVTDENNETTTDVVDSVKVNDDGSVDLSLESGDQVSLDKAETEELMNTGEVESVDAPTEEFEVTREVENPDGTTTEVTSVVEAESEDDAIEKVKLVDSRRGRNSRKYRVNSEDTETTEEPTEFEVTREIENPDGDPVEATTTVIAESPEEAVEKVKSMDSRKGRKVNSKSYVVKNSDDVDMEEFDVTREVKNSDGETTEMTTTVMAESPEEAIEQVKSMDSRRRRNSRKYRIGRKSNSTKKNSTEMMDEMKDFKVVRNCKGKNGKVRKVASVTAPTIEEAIEAVRAKDTEDKIEADGYAELVEDLNKNENVIINSDVEEEVIEDPTSESNLEDILVEDDEVRDSNSYKGVSDYVRRAYGINLK